MSLVLTTLTGGRASVLALDGARDDGISSGQQGRIREESLAMARLKEVLGLMSAFSLHGPPSPEELATSLRVLVRTVDPYGDYVGPDVLLSMESLKSGSYGGVGLDVFWDRDGRFVCIPVPGGPAMESGVTYGQELLAVGGHDTHLLGIEDIGHLLRGEPETTALIRVRDQTTGEARDIYLKRRLVRTISVVRVDTGSLPGVRIIKFTEHTPQELSEILQGVNLSKGLIIDVRGNPGGDLQAALKTAGLFLDAGNVVYVQRNRTGDKVFKSEKRLFQPRRLYVWQDHITASAAEVFLAAIVENRQGIGIGIPTFGKGVSQKLFGLSQGGAVLLSNAELLTPSGRKYDGMGLAPAYQVPQEMAWSDSAYRDMTRNILQGRDELESGGTSWWRALIGIH